LPITKPVEALFVLFEFIWLHFHTGGGGKIEVTNDLVQIFGKLQLLFCSEM